MMEDATRARFLGEIGQRVSADAVAEVHLFQPIRQGGIESGVAVVAVSSTPAQPRAEDFTPAEPGAQDFTPAQPGAENLDQDRLTVYTATYRLTLKGPERGKWEFTMNAEADAPLVTVDAVVRGVQRRSGDVEDPEKLTGDEFRELG